MRSLNGKLNFIPQRIRASRILQLCIVSLSAKARYLHVYVKINIEARSEIQFMMD